MLNNNMYPKSIFLYTSFVICVLFYSCDPVKRIARIRARHPEIVKLDTTYSHRNDTTKAILDRFSVNKADNSAAIDSALKVQEIGWIEVMTDTHKNDSAFAKHLIDSLINKLNKSIKGYIVNRPCLKDTLIKSYDGITVKVFDQKGSIGIIITKPEVIKDVKTPVAVTTIDHSPCAHNTTWYDYMAYGFTVLCWLMIAYLISVKIPK